MPDRLETLVVLAQTGDHEAYNKIVQRFQAMALSYAYSIVGDYELAEDARQEAFLGAYCDLLSLREPAAFPGWFRKIVKKHSIQLIRRRRRLMVPLEDAGDLTALTPQPDQAAAEKEQRERIAEAIGRLPASERDVTRLFYFEDLSLVEIGQSLRIPVQTVKSRLHTARARLRQRLMEIVKKKVQQQDMQSGRRTALREASSLAVSQFDDELKGLLHVMSDEDQRRAVDLLCAKGRLLRFMGRMDEARASFEEGLGHPVLKRNAFYRVRLRSELGLTLVHESEYERGRGELQASLAVARRQENQSQLLASILNGLGMCAWGQGDFRRARAFYQESAEISKGFECVELAAEAKNNLALLEWKMGRLDQALKEFRDCLVHWKKIRNRYASALTLMNVGIIEENLGRLALARRHYEQALELAREVQFAQVEAATQGNLSNLALTEERWKDAFDAAVRALDLARRIGDRRSQAIALENQALACLGLGRLEAARECEEDARRLARAIGDRERELSLDLVAIERQITARATTADTAAQIGVIFNKAKEMGLNSEIPRILRLLATAQASQGLAAQAQRTLENALKECRRQKNRPEEKRILALKTLSASQQQPD